MIVRQMRPQLVSALAEARVACLLGARQSGKTTLVRAIAEEEHPSRYVSLDDPAALELARTDPDGFVAGPDRLTIDEVQRAPDLLWAIKRSSTRTTRTTREGVFSSPARRTSSPCLRSPMLCGRVDYLTLWPFSQSELIGSSSSFLDRLFAGEPPCVAEAPVGRVGYAERIVRGGFPEAVEAGDARRRRFFSGYADSILGREVDELGSVRAAEVTGRVMRRVAARSASLSNLSSIGR